MSPESLQSFGVLAIALGFVLIGLGGFSTYQASQKIQHTAELRETERVWEKTAEIQTLLIRIQDLKDRAEQAPPPPSVAAESPPPAAYYRPPAPPPPIIAPQQPETPSDTGTTQQQAAAPTTPEPIGETPEVSIEPTLPAHAPADWEEPESLAPEVAGKYLSVHQQHVIADTLRAHGIHLVALESSYGDPEAREFAGELGKAVTEAGWVVKSITEHRGLPLESGITVSAASFPPRQETRAVYEALLSAGIPVTQQLDPKQHEVETLILVGTPL